jgi:hypothetical protein
LKKIFSFGELNQYVADVIQLHDSSDLSPNEKLHINFTVNGAVNHVSVNYFTFILVIEDENLK